METETALTLELLKFVNSVRMGLRHHCSNVQHAIAMLGMQKAKSFVIRTGMQAAVLSRESKLINQASFWNAALQKALFAQEVAKLLGFDADLAFSGALLQNYLLPVITNEMFEQYLEFISKRGEQTLCICEFEQKTFGFDHAMAGACLVARWNLPDDLVC